jgi:quercetin dioxygenase-like cupin family protein
MLLMPRHKYDDDLVDPELMPRPVLAVRTAIVAGPDGMELAAHQHPMAQMVYTARGVLTCEVSQGLWIVPPGCAICHPSL